jgi:hypothetical protein
MSPGGVPFEDLVGIDRGAAAHFDLVGGIGDQRAGRKGLAGIGAHGKFSLERQLGNDVPRLERGAALRGQHRLHAGLGHGIDRGLHLFHRPRIEGHKRQPEFPGRSHHHSRVEARRLLRGIDEKADAFKPRHQLLEQLQSLSGDLPSEVGKSRCIAAGLG